MRAKELLMDRLTMNGIKRHVLALFYNNMFYSKMIVSGLFFSGLLLSSLALSTHAAAQEDNNKHQADAAEALLPFEVVYDVGNNLISAGSANLSLKREGDEWIYNLSTRPTGVFKLTGKGKIQETSVFTVVKSANNNMRVLPKRYSYRQDKESKRSVDAWFNWDSNELTYKRRGEEVTEEFSDPVLDRLSVTLKVMNELKYRPFEEAKLTVFDSGRIRQVLFVNQGEETVSTQIGEIETIRVRSENSGSARHTVTWFAPSLGYVPVKIEQHKRGELVARLKLVKLRN